MELLTCLFSLCLTLEETAKQGSCVCHFAFLPVCMRVLFSPHPHQHLLFSVVLILAILECVHYYFILAFICISLKYIVIHLPWVIIPPLWMSWISWCINMWAQKPSPGPPCRQSDVLFPLQRFVLQLHCSSASLIICTTSSLQFLPDVVRVYFSKFMLIPGY